MKRVTGSLQTKYGKYYAVLNLYSSDGKRRQKWVSTDLPERGNKKAARAFLDELLVVYNKRQQTMLKAISKMKHPEEFLKEQSRLCRGEYVHEFNDYVCVDELGQLMRPNFVTSQFSKLLKAHGLRHIRYHDLRHSCASLLLAGGVPMKAIQEWLGHSYYRTTADVYSHLDFSSKAHSAEIISRMLAG